MNILIIADPLESFKIYKDTTFAMMREAQKRGHQVVACEMTDVRWQQARCVATHARIAQTARDVGFVNVVQTRPVLSDVLASLESFA